MAAAEPGDAHPVDLELLDDGRGPERPPRFRNGRVLTARTRHVLSAVGAVALIAVVVTTAQHGSGPATSTRSTKTTSTTSIARTPPHELVQLLDDQYRFSAAKGSLSLMVSVVNYGTTAIDVLQTRLPQAGSRPVPGPGGDLPFASPITLVPDRPTPLTVLARVSCPSVLTAPLADHVDVTLGRSGHPVRVASLSIVSLGTILDDARHQACGARSASGAIYPTMVPGSVHPVAGSTDGPPVIVSQLQIKNIDNGETTVSISGANTAGVSVGNGNPITLPAAATAVVTVRWEIQDCAALAAIRWPTLVLSVHLATSSANNTYGFDDTFGSAWRSALGRACA